MSNRSARVDQCQHTTAWEGIVEDGSGEPVGRMSIDLSIRRWRAITNALFRADRPLFAGPPSWPRCRARPAGEVYYEGVRLNDGGSSHLPNCCFSMRSIAF
jgi:hypothetical protein